MTYWDLSLAVINSGQMLAACANSVVPSLQVGKLHLYFQHLVPLFHATAAGGSGLAARCLQKRDGSRGPQWSAAGRLGASGHGCVPARRARSYCTPAHPGLRRQHRCSAAAGGQSTTTSAACDTLRCLKGAVLHTHHCFWLRRVGAAPLQEVQAAMQAQAQARQDADMLQQVLGFTDRCWAARFRLRV